MSKSVEPGPAAPRSARRVVITGATGLLGQALSKVLRGRGDQVDGVSRRPPAAGSTDIQWSPADGTLDPAALDGADVVVHLAGENLGAGRWTPALKARVLDSRRAGTELIARTMAACATPPGRLVSASAVGYYPPTDHSDGPALTEADGPGSGFMSEVCQVWEASADPARAADIEVVHPRIGVVLTPLGGALERMLTPFKLGAGGPIGTGRQPMSWITLEDTIRALCWLIDTPSLDGPFNVTAPEPVSQRAFARTLGRVLGRPAVVPLPAFAVRAAFGEMGEALLLTGQKVRPARLLDGGFHFDHPDLEPALRHTLGA